jgi:hypothetical protein
MRFLTPCQGAAGDDGLDTSEYKADKLGSAAGCYHSYIPRQFTHTFRLVSSRADAEA